MDKPNLTQFNWDICGHKNIVHFLQLAISGQRLAHAYLFAGADSLGKNAVAKKFIASLLCTAKDMIPCGQCANCLQLKNGFHPDIFYVQKEVNDKTDKQRREIVIDQIRELKAKLQQGTLLNGYKIALISEAQYLNSSSANGLLKVLEEPTAKTVLILLAGNPASLPATIVSRCQVIKFLPVATSVISDYIDSDIIAKQAGGRPGLAMNLAADEGLIKIIDSRIEKFFEVVTLDLNQRFDLVEDLVDWNKDEAINVNLASSLLDNWQSAIRDVLLVQTGQEKLVVNANNLSPIKKYAAQIESIKIKQICQQIEQTRKYFYQNINAKSALENLIINL